MTCVNLRYSGKFQYIHSIYIYEIKNLNHLPELVKYVHPQYPICLQVNFSVQQEKKVSKGMK